MDEPKPRYRRRWLQYSLRTLMLFMLVCTFPSAWVGWKLDETRLEQAVVADVEALGGRVDYHKVKGPPWITRHFRKVKVVDFESLPITDDELQQLEGMAGLEGLRLRNTLVTNEGLVHLEEMTGLEWVDLYHTQVTDAGVKKLQQAFPRRRITVDGHIYGYYGHVP